MNIYPHLLGQPYQTPDERWCSPIVSRPPEGMENPEYGCSICIVYARTRKECTRRARLLLAALEAEEEAETP